MRRLVLPAFLGALVLSTGCVQNVASSFGPGAWPLEMIQVDLLHKEGIKGSGITVAIIDTGIDSAHPQFAGRTLGWLDLVNNRPDPYDDNGHGTHVAGIVGARGDYSTLAKGFYLQGVAPEAKLLIIKAIAADGKGDETKVARAVSAAVSNDADIIVLSLGGDTFPILGTETEEEVNKAVRAGVYVVAAGGNGKDGRPCSITSPATEPNVIAVGAVRKDRSIAPFSCKGTDNDGSGPLRLGGRSDPDRKPEVVAPGDEILSTWKDPVDTEVEYALASGTSQAAPFVGGVIALILGEHVDLRRAGARGGEEGVDRVKEVLMTTSQKVGPLAGKGATAHDDAYGYGIVQAKAALDAL
ncbi:MAG TPA: S8 family serine peptidase [Candidatus Thermoplasmatota archaeon]|nr:S8 family serine peptidase [Candidatus Thermoplasmatota archaeon]